MGDLIAQHILFQTLKTKINTEKQKKYWKIDENHKIQRIVTFGVYKKYKIGKNSKQIENKILRQ